MNTISVAEAARRWGISERRVRLLCSEGRIEGAFREGRAYRIPEDALRPADGRERRGRIIPEAYAPLFARIDALRAELGKRRPLTPGEVLALRDEFLIEFTHNSTAIEGNTLTLKETALVLGGITIDQKPLKDHLEAVGHRDAFLYVEELAASDTPLTPFELKQIHALVLSDQPQDRGRYRRVPVRIMGAFAVPAEPWQIEERMAALLSDDKARKKRVHPIERVALFHLDFEGIHPFIDGNGRTGRLLMNLELIREGYPPLDIKFADRKRYYDAFDTYYRDGSPDAMVRLVGGYVEERLRETLRILGED